jgi:hypothetical protein
MKADRVQAQRFELKYRVSDSAAAQIRDFVGSYLEYDEYSLPCPDHAYFNHSLYLDSEDLRLHWDVINSVKNRYKLRLRFYDEDPESPVFFEIKRRVNDAILKQRCPVRREAVSSLLSGQLPAPEDLCSTRPESLAAIQQFSRLMLDLGATPKMHIAYRREAWEGGEGNSVRVTLDREVYGTPRFTADLTTRIDGGIRPFANQVILELKFTARYPVWFRDLVESFDAMQCGCAKYADSVVLLGEDRVGAVGFDPVRRHSLDQYVNRRKLSAADAAAQPAFLRKKNERFV